MIGPLFGDAANEAGIAVSGKNVNVLSFSNNPTCGQICLYWEKPSKIRRNV